MKPKLLQALRLLREDRELTQKELCDKLGLRVDRIAQLERPPGDLAERVAAACGFELTFRLTPIRKRRRARA